MSSHETVASEDLDRLEALKGEHYLRAKKVYDELRAAEAAKCKTPIDRLRKQMVDANKFDVEFVVRAGLDPEKEYAHFLHERKKIARSAYFWLARVVFYTCCWFVMFYFPAYYFN